jgi:cytochrome c biogenesis protein
MGQLAGSATRALTLFAGAGGSVAGLQAISDFIESNVPEAERNKAGEVLVRILNGVLYELVQMTREAAKLKPLPADAETQQFMTQSVLALSDLPLYPAPFLLNLTDFTQVQASVFQVARAPGKTVVYLGCALLILGIFAMLYVRERRLWIWLEPLDGRSDISAATMALSTNRKTMDGDKEFEHLKRRLLALEEQEK